MMENSKKSNQVELRLDRAVAGSLAFMKKHKPPVLFAMRVGLVVLILDLFGQFYKAFNVYGEYNWLFMVVIPPLSNFFITLMLVSTFVIFWSKYRKK